MILLICRLIYYARNLNNLDAWKIKLDKYYMPLFRYWKGGGETKDVIVGELCKKAFIIPRLSFFITTRCTLRCDGCAALIPYFQECRDVDLACVLSDMKALLNSDIKAICCLNIVGGEPFLHRNIKEILCVAVESVKVKSIELTTNATVALPDEIIKVLENPKVTVFISDYGDVNGKHVETLSEIFRAHHINFRVLEQEHWWDFGSPNYNQREKKINDEFYNRCYQPALCRVVYKGKLLSCARGVFLVDHHKILQDFLDIHSSDFGVETLWESYVNINSDICDYCTYNNEVKIECGKQLSRE